jgi:uncharacterized protein DUF1844
VADPKSEETFKVIDRRHFTEQGDLRQEVVEQEKREEEAAAKKISTAPPASKTQSKAPASSQGASKAASPQSGVIASPSAAEQSPANVDLAETPEAAESSRSFQMLVDFLTRNAAAMLGGMADPRTGQAFVDLEGAREVIDMLDALREKTRGNLSKADDDLLIEVLGSLKLTFMEISKAATEAMAKKAGQKK